MRGFERSIGITLILSFYGLWASFVLAATFGASRVLPIAGRGFKATPAPVSVAMGVASVVGAAVVGAILPLGRF
jgi:hypothetical protein